MVGKYTPLNPYYRYFPTTSGYASCKKERLFWLKNLHSLNGFPFSASKSEEQFELEIIGDASDV